MLRIDGSEISSHSTCSTWLSCLPSPSRPLHSFLCLTSVLTIPIVSQFSVSHSQVFNVGRSRPSEILDPNTVLAWQKDANKVFQHSELKRLESIKVQARAKEAQNVQAKETVQLYMYKQSYAKKAAARDAELQVSPSSSCNCIQANRHR